MYSNKKATDLLKKADTLEAQRVQYLNECQNVADLFRPLKANITSTRIEGDKSKIRTLFDSRPIDMSLTLASILFGTILNRAGEWFQFDAVNKDINELEEVAQITDHFVKVMLAKMYDDKSNFEAAIFEGFRDTVDFGTVATFIEEGDNFDFVCTTLSIKDYLISENRDGKIDYVILKTEKTARQIIQQWEEVPESVLKANEKDPFTKFKLQLHIYPREERDKNKIDVLNKEFAGCWILEEGKAILQETGWDEFPVQVGRINKIPSETYGTGISMYAAPDAKLANKMWQFLMEASEKAIKPPFLVNAEFSKSVNLNANALNFPKLLSGASSARPAVEPLMTGSNIPISIDLLNIKYSSMEKIFFLDKLKIIDDPRATATQVLEQSAERYRLMLPLSVGIEEYIESTLNRIFGILFRKSYRMNDLPNGGSSYELLPNAPFNMELPEALKTAPDIKTSFVNPINQAQKIAQMSAIDNVINSAGALAQLDPNVLDNINADEVIRSKAEILNSPTKILRSKAEIQETRNTRQQQAQNEQQGMDLERVVDAAAKLK